MTHIARYRVGQAVYLPNYRAQAVTRHTVLSIVIRCSAPGAGGADAPLRPADCSVGYILSDGVEVHEDTIYGSAAEAFATITA